MFGNTLMHSSYYDPSDYYSSPYGHSLAQQRGLAQQQRALEQQRAQRLRRAQYLPDEVEEDSSDEDAHYQLSPRERLNLETRKRQEAMEMERRRREEALVNQKRLEAQRQEEARRQAHQQHYQPPQQQRTAHSPSKLPKSPSSNHHIPIRSRSSSPQAPEPQHPPTLAVVTHPVPPEVLERQNEAATKIQKSYRIHRSLHTLKNLEREFEDLKAPFKPPMTIDFEGPDGIISVTASQPLPSTFDARNTPKVAFNSTNYPLHKYVESLNRILIKLDAVESCDNMTVRKERRRIIGKVEAEASRADSYWKQVWASHLAQSSRLGQKQGHSMNVDCESSEGEDDTSDSETFELADEGVVSEAASETKSPINADLGGDFVMVH